MFWNTILLLVTVKAARGDHVEGVNNSLSDEFIAEVNSKATTWKAGRNFPSNTSDHFLHGLTCTWTNSTVKLMTMPYTATRADLPESFDARTKWGSCPTLSEIRNQGGCGSCWAISVASVISDRECIQKGVQFHASTEDITSCCKECGEGCHGGYPDQAFQHYSTAGVVSGGLYGTHDGCKPYSAEEFVEGHTPQCVTKCTNTAYPKSYENDLHRGSKAYVLSGEDQIKQELFTNGPVTAAFEVYSDFKIYQSGVYQHVSGGAEGGHAVKVIGWGTENGTPYWLIANSWGPTWGEDGYVKFLRGSDHCKIESMLVAATMV